jgi:hypothetical protein
MAGGARSVAIDEEDELKLLSNRQWAGRQMTMCWREEGSLEHFNFYMS